MSRIVKLDEIYFDLDDFSYFDWVDERVHTKQGAEFYLSNEGANELKIILNAQCVKTPESYILKPVEWIKCQSCPRLIPVTENGNGKCWECVEKAVTEIDKIDCRKCGETHSSLFLCKKFSLFCNRCEQESTDFLINDEGIVCADCISEDDDFSL